MDPRPRREPALKSFTLEHPTDTQPNPTQVSLVTPAKSLVLGYYHPTVGNRFAPWFSVQLGEGAAADAAEAPAEDAAGAAPEDAEATTDTRTILKMGPGFRFKVGHKDQVVALAWAAEGKDG